MPTSLALPPNSHRQIIFKRGGRGGGGGIGPRLAIKASVNVYVAVIPLVKSMTLGGRYFHILTCVHFAKLAEFSCSVVICLISIDLILGKSIFDCVGAKCTVNAMQR